MADGTDPTLPTTWRDARRPLWPLALLVPGLPFLSWVVWDATGRWWAWWLAPLLVFGAIPLVDLLVGDDPPEEAVPRLAADRHHHWLTYLYLPARYAGLVLGCSLLEAVNYLEHYGLARQRTATGRYEKVDPRHSWNSDRTVTNVFLFQLQRHSDHHANPLRGYQTLRSFDSSPQLPAGYATMVVAALLPPLWRRVMDHRVLAHYGGDLSRANVHPPARRRLAARRPTSGASQPSPG